MIQSRREQFEALFPSEPAFRWKQIEDALFSSAKSWNDVTTISKTLRESLTVIPWMSVEAQMVQVSLKGDTHKALLKVTGEKEIETVLMKNRRGAWTICVSSQVGCAMRCGFCATGKMGLTRSLIADEIIDQYRFWLQYLQKHPELDGRISNIVFMGMGEPLANYDNVLAAVRRLTRDVGLSARSLTISTIGIPDAIRRLALEAPPVTLALSLHAPDDALRDELVPPNRRWPIGDVLEAVRDYRAAGGRRVTVEYTLIRDVNDSPAQAAALAGLLRPLRVHVNCIPMNPTGDPGYRPPPRRTVAAFASALRAAGVNATVRQNRGVGIGAACGQLHRRAPQPVVALDPERPLTLRP